MEKHGFSKSYIQFLEILYKDYISLIINNGFLFETAMMLRETTTENIGLTIPNSKKTTKNITLLTQTYTYKYRNNHKSTKWNHNKRTKWNY